MGRKVAWSLSGEKTFTIANAADGSLVTPVDLGTPFKVIGIVCEDCSNIAAASNLADQVAMDGGSTYSDLYEENDPSTIWSKGTLPVTGTLAFVLTHAFGARQIRLILSNNTDGEVVFSIFGLDGHV